MLAPACVSVILPCPVLFRKRCPWDPLPPAGPTRASATAPSRYPGAPQSQRGAGGRGPVFCIEQECAKTHTTIPTFNRKSEEKEKAVGWVTATVNMPQTSRIFLSRGGRCGGGTHVPRTLLCGFVSSQEGAAPPLDTPLGPDASCRHDHDARRRRRRRRRRGPSCLLPRYGLDLDSLCWVLAVLSALWLHRQC